MAIRTVFSHCCWVWSGLRSSGVWTVFSRSCQWQWWPFRLSSLPPWVWSGLPFPSLAPANDGHPDCLLSLLLSVIRSKDLITLSSSESWHSGCPKCRRWVLFTGQVVTPLLTFHCFTKPSNLLTPTWVFCMLAHGAEGPGEWIPWENVCLWVQILPWKFQPISSTFTPWKSHISVLFGMAPPPGGLLLSILAPKWAALTLTLCTEHCVPVSHLHVPHQNSTSTFQYSVRGAVMPDAITYGQDCMSSST